MAIQYAGSRNLIGYGAAQVYKDRDLTKGVKYEQEKAAKLAAAKAKKKVDNTKNLTTLLDNVDYSNVRNADVEHFKSEFDAIMSNANAVTASGVNPLTDINLRKQINKFNANVMGSVNAKDVYNKNLTLATTNDDYQNEGNITALANEYESSMFGEGASFLPTEGQGEEGTAGYVPGTTGNKAMLNPELHVEDWYKTNTENLTTQQITLDPSGEYKHTAQNGKTQFFQSKEEAEDYQLNLAANDILSNHNYSGAFAENQEQAAIDAGYINGEGDANTLDYVKDQIRSRTTEVKGDRVTDLPKASTNISINTAKDDVAAGELMPTDTYKYTNVHREIGGVATAMPELSYSTTSIPAVGNQGEQGYIPEKKGQTFDFGMKPLDIRPGEAGFMVFGDNTARVDAGLDPMEFGYKTSGENIKFTPNSIVFKSTAKKAFEITMPYGKVKVKKGEALDDALVEALNNADREGDFEALPWLEGKSTEGGTTISIGFNESVHARFSTFISKQNKQKRAVYERVMKNIGIEPLSQNAEAR